MTRLQHVAAVLSELGTDLGLPAITLDDSDRATLAFDDIKVTFAYDAAPVELLSLYAEIGEFEAVDDPAAAFLLEVGFGSWASGRMAIGLDDAGQTVLGHLSIPVILLDGSTLKRTLMGLLEVALPLKERLAARDFRLALPNARSEAGADPSSFPV